MTDPVEIDLEAIEERRKQIENYHGDLTIADVNDLIAAVEALRKQVAVKKVLVTLAQEAEHRALDALNSKDGK